jgi:arsenate reductase
VDISRQKSQCIDEFSEIDFDYIITLCDNAAQMCPVFEDSVKVIHRPFEDPYFATGSEEDVMETFRRVRDEIRDFVEAIPNNLR